MHLKDVQEKTDQILHSNIPSNGVPGAVVLALARDGSTIYSGVAGTRGQGSDQPMTKDTVFWIASCTKLLAALCAMKCVEQGLITLDEDILPLLPELASQKVRDGFMTPDFKLVDREGHITLRQLLSMTAGLSYPLAESLVAKFPTIPTGTEPFMPADKSTYIGPLDCQPGTKWAYTATLEWTGVLIQKISGLSLGEYLQKYILGPCGVDEITFELTPDMRERLAGAHFRWPDGSVTARGKIFSDDVKFHSGGAGAYSTAEAFSQVLLLLINEGKHPVTGNQVLKPELMKEMFRPQLTETQRACLDLPSSANNNQVMLPGVQKQWGLGFLLTPEGTPSGRGRMSGTWAGLANTHWMADPTKGVVMVVFAQLIPQEDKKVLLMRDACERVIYGEMQN